MATFKQAYDAVAARYSTELWLALPPSEVTQAIYRELRRLDADHFRSATTSGRTQRGAKRRSGPNLPTAPALPAGRVRERQSARAA